MALVGTNGQGIGTSPLAQWVAYVSELAMSDDERQQMNLFIDKLYKDVENGWFNFQVSECILILQVTPSSCALYAIFA